MARTRNCADSGSDEEMGWLALHPFLYTMSVYSIYKMAAKEFSEASGRELTSVQVKNYIQNFKKRGQRKQVSLGVSKNTILFLEFLFSENSRKMLEHTVRF